MPHDPLIAIEDVLQEIGFLEDMAKELTFETFENSSQAVRAAAYSVQTISEAVRHIPRTWLDAYPNEPWDEIIAIGNKIRHEYFRLSDAILWQVITEDVQSLKRIMTDLANKKES